MKKYLKDVRKSLPENCLFDKGKIGSFGIIIAMNQLKLF